MKGGERILLLGAVALVLLGSVGGLAHAWLVEHETLLSLREQYETAFIAAAGRDMDAARAALAEAQAANARYVRVIDAHTHVIKIASVLVLTGLLLAWTGWSEGRQRLVAWLLLGGAVVYPLSLYAQALVPGLVFEATTAAGALAVVAGTASLVLGLFRATALTDDPD